MNCLYCHSTNILERKGLTELGYKRYQCRECRHRYNERTGTPYNYLEYPTDIVVLMLFHYTRYKLSFDNVAEIFWLRGFKICGETIRLWFNQLGVLLGKSLRKKRRGKAGKSWFVDETYVKVSGQWCYLYRACDKKGELIDCFLSPTRDKKSAMAFFKSAIDVVGHEPEKVTTDKNPAYPKAIAKSFSSKVKHRTNKYLNNRIEQDHRDIKSRYYALRGFKDFMCAFIFCVVFEEVRNFFGISKNKGVIKVNSSQKRKLITSKFQEFQKIMAIF